MSADDLHERMRSPAGGVASTQELEAALRTADVVYTDCWPSRQDAESRRRITSEFAPYRITAAALELTPPSCIFLTCPPVTRGEEVSDDALTSSRCKVYEAKDHLLHTQNALLSIMMELNSAIGGESAD